MIVTNLPGLLSKPHVSCSMKAQLNKTPRMGWAAYRHLWLDGGG